MNVQKKQKRRWSRFLSKKTKNSKDTYYIHPIYFGKCFIYKTIICIKNVWDRDFWFYFFLIEEPDLNKSVRLYPFIWLNVDTWSKNTFWLEIDIRHEVFDNIHCTARMKIRCSFSFKNRQRFHSYENSFRGLTVLINTPQKYVFTQSTKQRICILWKTLQHESK